jgi:hypothetical protein
MMTIGGGGMRRASPSPLRDRTTGGRVLRQGMMMIVMMPIRRYLSPTEALEQSKTRWFTWF